jgi:hypothetical protein
MSTIAVYRGSDGLMRLQDDFGHFFETLPKALSQDCFQAATIFSDEARSQVMTQGLVWHGGLYDSLGNIEPEGTGYKIDIPKYGFQVAKMEPHFVKLPDSRNMKKAPLRQFAKEKGLPGKPGMFVMPHDWIEPTKMMARARLENYVNAKNTFYRKQVKKSFRGRP